MLIFSRLPLTKHFKTQPMVRRHSLKGEYLVKLLGFHQDKKAFLHRRNWWCLEENHKLISHKEPVLGASSTDSISCPWPISDFSSILHIFSYCSWGSMLGKEYIKAVYCNPDYLTYMQRTSCEMSDWIKQKLKSRLQGEMSITSDVQRTLPL